VPRTPGRRRRRSSPVSSAGAGCRVQGAGCRVQGAGCRVPIVTRARASVTSPSSMVKAEGSRRVAMVRTAMSRVQGGFKGSSQHLEVEELVWVAVRCSGPVWRGVSRCGLRGGHRRPGVCSARFGGWSRTGVPARRRRLRAACRGRSGRVGSGTVAGCRLCRWMSPRAGTCLWRSGRRSRCCGSWTSGSARSPQARAQPVDDLAGAASQRGDAQWAARLPGLGRAVACRAAGVPPEGGEAVP